MELSRGLLRVGLNVAGGCFGVAALWAAASLRSTGVFLLHCGRMRRAVLWVFLRCRLAACWLGGIGHLPRLKTAWEAFAH
ncbi:MAG: hypothetical protein CME44_03055 [Haliea sp.]|nr:hypothetical protein [Haliea sp.]